MSHENNQVALIYEKFLDGDHNAIANLQQIDSVEFQSANPNHQSTNHHKSSQKQQRKSVDRSKQKKKENIRTYLRGKVTELKNIKYDSKRQLPKVDGSQGSKQYNEPKPFPKVKKRTDLKSQKNTVSGDGKNKIDQMIQSKGGSMSKIKTTSNNFQQKMNRNIIRDQDKSQKQSTPPTSKHSIRIRNPTLNKKVMDELLKINEEERRLQAEILQLHLQTKQEVQQIKDKHNLKENMVEGVQRKDQMLFGGVLDEIAKKSPFIEGEEKKVCEIEGVLEILDQKLKQRKNRVKKLDTVIQNSELNPYLEEMDDIFQQRESEQDEDILQLPMKQNKEIDPTKTYQTTMNQMRNKKWGLKKRMAYEGKKPTQKAIFKEEIEESKVKELQEKNENGENKVVVNSKFRQFLFD